MAVLPHADQAVAPARSLAGLEDAELVAEVRRGCDRAFEELYGRYHRRIAAYIHQMVKDHGRAEDIAQEVFMSAVRRIRETDRPIAFKPWIYEIAKNACIDQFRRARRTDEVSYDADEALAPADHGKLVAKELTPDAAVDQKQQLDDLCGAFGGLSETHHEILVMRELEGLSYREIGERLELTRPAVESTLFRARRRLGEEYEELVSGRRCERVQAIIASAVDAALPGARDQRRLAAHLSHCQACRRHANLAGLDTGALAPARPVRSRIAAFVPLPLFLRRRWFGEEVTAGGNHHVSTLAQLTAQLGPSADPALASWAKAVVAAATLAIAGLAGGAAVSDEARSGVGGSATKAPLEAAAAPPAAAAPAAPASSAAASAPSGGVATSGAPASRAGSNSSRASRGLRPGAATKGGASQASSGAASAPSGAGSGSSSAGGQAPSRGGSSSGAATVSAPSLPSTAPSAPSVSGSRVLQQAAAPLAALPGVPAGGGGRSELPVSPTAPLEAVTAAPAAAGQALQAPVQRVTEAVSGTASSAVGAATSATGAAPQAPAATTGTLPGG